MSDDLISRQAVVDVVHHTIYEFFDVVEDDDESPLTYKDVTLLELNKSISTRIKDLPSAQHWIPASERLPEDERYVLVTTVSGDVTEAKYWQEEGLWVKELVVMSVTAWMPFMEPYKEDMGNANKTD